MPHLAFNTVLPEMRAKYLAAIAVAPFGLMFASFGPAYFLAGWLARAMGISPNSPVISHPNGIVWLTIFLSATVALMLAGYALGWLVNQAVSRYMLGWSQEKVRSVYFRSEVPGHWLKPGVDTRSNSTARSVAKWEEQRKVGAFHYICVRGMLAWGLPMFIAMYAVPILLKRQEFSTRGLTFNVLLWLVAGAAFGALNWYISEWNYRKLKGRSEASQVSRSK